MAKKVYVKVNADFLPDGAVRPRKIYWEDTDGICEFEIAKVLDIRRAPSLKAGGTGIRYKIRIDSRETYIWFDDLEYKWFVEAKE